MDEVTVVIVTFNSAHCVAALGALLKDFPNVIVSDNGSGDDTIAEVRRHLPRARVLDNGRNLGFGAANNRALEQVTTPYAFLLNPDCEVDAQRMGELLAVARDNPQAALIAPHLLKSDGSPEVNYRWPSPEWESRGPGAEGVCCVGFACGAALLFNMQVMREVGFFDEGFFLYYEDDDLCARIFKKHLSMLLVPQVKLKHSSRGSVRGKSPLRAEYLRGYHHAQSKIRFAAKYPGHHEGARSAVALRRKVLALALLSLPARLLLPQPRQVARLVGRIAGLWNAPTALSR